MKRTVYSLITKFIVGFIGIVLISAVPSMFRGKIDISLSVYFVALRDIVNSLMHFTEITYHKQTFYTSFDYSVFPSFWDAYGYSMVIFSASFVLALLIGLFLTYLTVLQSRKMVNRVSTVINFLESVPDFLVFIGMVSLVIFLYERTGFLLFNVAGAFQDRAYALPIITLTLLPIILFYRIMLLAVLNEQEELYVDLAKTKGLARSKIILVHIYRNALITLGSHVKSIFVFLFSNLVMVEYIYNIYGAINYVLNHPQLNIFVVTILLFYIPIFLFMAMIKLVSEYLTGKEVAVL